MATIITIVHDSKADQVIGAILNVASTGSSGDGKIFVSSVENMIDIQTKAKNPLV